MVFCIVLTGLPGSGKSTIGAMLAVRLQYDFLDTDSLIEEQQGMSVAEIFTRFGEARFRELEKETIEALSGRLRTPGQGLVLSVGGGIPESHYNRRLLKQLGVVVYIKASVDELADRLRSDNSRPLLQANCSAGEKAAAKENDPHLLRDRLKTLLDRRTNAYEEADIIIDTSQLITGEVVNRIEKALNTRSSNL